MTTRDATKTSGAGDGPVGRTEVVAAVLTHAADLFAERGPAATSIRDVAARAGVNHGLVFRHFGTKDHLIAEVLNYLSVQTAAADDESTLSSADPRWQRHWLVLARCLLDGFPVGELQQQFPIVARLVDRAREYHDDERAAAVAAAEVAALELGWRLFGPFLRGATGLNDVPDAELQQAIDTDAARILRGGTDTTRSDPRMLDS